MNKLFTKIAALALGAAMVVGVGVSVGSKKVSSTEALESTVTFTTSSTNKFGTVSSQGGSKSGTLYFGTGTTFPFDYTKTNSYIKSGKSDYESYSPSGWSGYLQIGSGNAYDALEITSSAFASYTIKSVSIFAAGANHNYQVSVGSYSSTATALPSSAPSSALTVSPNVSGNLTISFTQNSSTSKAFYLKSIAVVYEENSEVTVDSIIADLNNDAKAKTWKKGEVLYPSNLEVYVEYSDGTDATITDGSGVKFGPNADQTSATLSAGNNTITVNYGGQTDTVTVFGKAPTGITVITSTGESTVNLNAHNQASVSDDLSFEVSYNTTPSTTDYAATLSCSTAGWSKTADDGEGNLTLTFESNGTFNFALTSDDDPETSVSLTYVVEGIPASEYALYSGDMTDGKYLITVDNDALKNTISSNRGDYDTVAPVDGKVSTPAPSIVWEIASSGDYWTIYNAAVQQYFASNGTKNQAGLVSDGSDNKALWTIEESSEGVYHFTNKNNSESSVNANLQKNGTYGFACYAAYSDITLYKLAEPAKKIVNTRLTTSSGSITASVGANSWTVTGFVFEVQYENESTWNAVVPTYVVSESVPTSYTDVGEYGVHFKVTYQGTDYHAGTSFTASVTANVTSLKDFHDGTITLKTSRNSLTDSDYYLVRGTVVGINGYQYYIQEGSYGLLVFNESNYHDTYYSTIALGDYVYVYSQVYKYYNLVETSSRGIKQSVEKVGTQTLPDAAEFSTVASFMAGNQSVRASLYNTAIDSTNLATIADFSGSSTLDQQFTAYDANSSSDTVTVFISKNVAADDKAAIVTKLQKITADDKVDFVRTVVAYYNGNQISLSSADQIIIHTPAEDKLLSWGTNYLFIGNPDFDGDGTGLCKTNNYYKDAKIQLFILEKEESGSITKLQSESEYAELLDRYTDWATACGDTKPFVEDYNFLNPSMIPSIISSESTATAIIIIVSVIGVSALGGFFFLRKRKEI